MTSTASTAATQGAPQTPGIRHPNGLGEPAADPMSLQALFAALLANGADGAAGRAPGTPAAVADAAGGNDLPGSPAGLPPLRMQATMQELLSASAAADAPAAAAALAALLQGGDALRDPRPWAEGRRAGPEGAGAADASGALPDAAAALLAAQQSNSAFETPAVMSPGPLPVEPAPAPQASAGTATPGDMRGSTPVPPALAIALAAIARGDAASPGPSADGATPADADGVPLPMSPVPPPPPGVALLQAPGGVVAPGAEPIVPHATAASASGELQQALREAFIRTGIGADVRIGIDSPEALPMAAGAVATAPTGGERPMPVWTLSTPLHNAQQWAEEVGDRIRWMAGNQVQSAELSISPPELGAIKIRISVHQDHMSISFSSPSAQVRETLEEAIPRLRDLMSGNGYDAVDVDVSHDRPDDRQADASGHRSDAAGGPDTAPEAIETPLSRRSGGLDLYA